MIRARADFSEVRLAFREIARFRGRPIADVMRQSGRRVAVRLTKYTQPFGFGQDAKALGEGAVERDVRLMFRTESSAFERVRDKAGEGVAKGFWRLMKDGKTQEAQRLLDKYGIRSTIVDEVDRAAHKAARNRKGHVREGSYGRFIVTAAEKVAGYVEELKKRVGLTASGWAAAARDLGGYRGLRAGDNVPAWKKPNARQGRGDVGGGRVESPTRDPRVIAENRVPWLSQACPESTQLRALREEEGTINREVERALQVEARKAGFK